MKHRFRYLDESGRQVEVEDLSALREHVHAGRVDPETLLYDTLTDEWAPAAAHSAFRLLDDPLTRDSDPESESAPAETGSGRGPEEAGSGSGRTGGEEPAFPDLNVTLAPDATVESADEVVEKLLKERERDRGEHNLPSVSEGFSSGGREVAPREEPELPFAAAPPPDDPSDRLRMPGLPDPDDEPLRPRSTDVRPRSGSRRREHGRERRRASAGTDRGTGGGSRDAFSWRRFEVSPPVLVLSFALVVLLTFFGVNQLMDAGGAEAAPGSGEDGGTVRTSTNSTWAAAEGGAFRDMVEGVDSLRGMFSVEKIPPSWLAGPYLADAGDYPDVEAYWRNYLLFVDAVRSQDTLLFRRGFVRRLEAQAVTGPIASIRLARALETFRESQPSRDTVYARMEDLALAALDLHELLIDRSADIVYDPVTEDRPSRQPILEAWSDDLYLRGSLWALLDRITANLALLEYDTGSGRSDLTERLFQELRTRSLARPADTGGG